ncbi:hypothetical protein D9758_014226 [Tetrapyrgos nigripes]|uniref:Uncharacterized protein n=1 Tax=Tetrapyrgos nigripes TaxID=182062 RepID=A0A8H5CX21_9AGAR|nr:hypothetical protein D9758_014226 [Tetrapyrgos nigripes]
MPRGQSIKKPRLEDFDVPEEEAAEDNIEEYEDNTTPRRSSRKKASSPSTLVATPKQTRTAPIQPPGAPRRRKSQAKVKGSTQPLSNPSAALPSYVMGYTRLAQQPQSTFSTSRMYEMNYSYPTLSPAFHYAPSGYNSFVPSQPAREDENILSERTYPILPDSLMPYTYTFSDAVTARTPDTYINTPAAVPTDAAASALADNTSSSTPHPSTTNTSPDESLRTLQSIIDEIRNPQTLFWALQRLYHFLDNAIPNFPDQALQALPLVPNSLVDKVTMSFVKELFHTDHDPDLLWESAKLFITRKQFDELVVRRVNALKERAGSPYFQPESTAESAPPADQMPKYVQVLPVALPDYEFNTFPDSTTSKPITFPMTPETPSPSKSSVAISKMPLAPTPNTLSPSSPSNIQPKLSFAERLAQRKIPLPAERDGQTMSAPVMLPKECQVTNAALQDALLVDEGCDYNSLPPLVAGKLISWSLTQVRKGNVKFTEWGRTLPDSLEVDFWISFFKFVRHQNYVNLSRIDPRDLAAFSGHSSNSVRSVLYVRSPPEIAICLFPVLVEASHLVGYTQLKGQDPKRYHKLDAILHSQEVDRAVAVITMILSEGRTEMAAEIVSDVLSFSTRVESTSPNASASSPASENRAYSSATGSSSTSTSSNSFSLPFDALVRIYDATHAAEKFDVNADLTAIDTILPCWSGEIPRGSLAVVGSTITSTNNNRAGPPLKVNFNIRFAIVLGVPAR